MLSVTAPAAQSAMVFTGVFVVIWLGAAIVTVNAQLLGSSMYVDVDVIVTVCERGIDEKDGGRIDLLYAQIVLSERVRAGVLCVSTEHRDARVHADKNRDLAHCAACVGRWRGFSLVDTRCDDRLRCDALKTVHTDFARVLLVRVTLRRLRVWPCSVGRVHVETSAAEAKSADSVPSPALLPLYQLDGAYPVRLAVSVRRVRQYNALAIRTDALF